MPARLLLSTSVAVAALATGCSEPAGTHGGLTETDARQAGVQVAREEGARRDTDLYGVELEVAGLDQRVFASGAEYWDVTLADPDGVRRVCVTLLGRQERQRSGL